MERWEMRYASGLVWLVASAFFAWAFHTRYWSHRDCIAAATSSCLTAEGDALTAGGAIWMAPALVTFALGLRSLLATAKRRSQN